MIIELLTLSTIVMLALYRFDITIPIWIAILPLALSYLIRIAILAYERFSISRWEEHQRIRALEVEGIREFRDVMIGTLVALIRRKPTSDKMVDEPEVVEDLPEDSEYMPPGYEEENGDVEFADEEMKEGAV